ncbi:AAA family ATPase [Curtobacterium sp. MCBD17_032]|uniref:AAA family ATPase n=1 Tax=Curtobacterium sp. MCBD17_032 TaxID=2175659 RepID=UPI000DAA8041|nr:AAA family ATPase [Curtobacterium sp. MCBD17_032]PZE81087.1 hypothetical protein DEI91_13270 [Curtobacterium sp. MCBD17_032]
MSKDLIPEAWTPQMVADFTAAMETNPSPAYFKNFLKMMEARVAKDHVDRLVHAAENPVEPLSIVTEEEIERRPSPEWWVPDLLQKGTVCVFAGEAGIGKTFTLIDWTRCIATGVPCMGQPTGRGTVLYVAAEGASAFGKRVRAWNSANNTKPPQGSINYVEKGVDLSDETSVQRLEVELDRLQPDIIVLDTLSQLASLESENDAAGLARVFRVAKRLREHKEGSTVILVHHVNKGAGGVRGSSVIRSNADTVIVAKSKGDGFYLSTEIAQDGKQKDGQPVRIEGLKLTDHAGSAVVTRDSKAVEDPDLKLLRELFADGKPHTRAEAREHAGIRKPTNSDTNYVRWNRKWRAWTKTGEAILQPAEDGSDGFILLDLVK